MSLHQKTIARYFIREKHRYYVPISSRTVHPSHPITTPLDRFHKVLEKRWDYPAYMFNAVSGGHISALREHTANLYFAVIDLKSYYETITDTKLHRSLRSVGVPHSEAFKLTGESTVRVGKKMQLPRGFHQSSLLASLVFDRSLLGSLIRSKNLNSLITVYNDDIVMSSTCLEKLSKDFSLIIDAAKRSNFKINTKKTQSPRELVEVFNLLLSQHNISFSEKRIEKFVRDMLASKSFCRMNNYDYFSDLLHRHADYIVSIDRKQFYALLKRICG